LDNVTQHAQARRVMVGLEQNEEVLTLTIEDDGQGFKVAPQAAERQFGLVGMRERAALIGGSLEIADRAGQGTTIRLHSGAGI
jgi:signal transduction histidine kinase